MDIGDRPIVTGHVRIEQSDPKREHSGTLYGSMYTMSRLIIWVFIKRFRDDVLST